MKIGVVSDTHDRLPTLRRAVQLFARLEVQAIFHAGDFIAPFAAQLISKENAPAPVHCVFGNNDGEREGLKKMLPQIVDAPLSVELAGKTIVMHHYIDWLTPRDIAPADVVITGHTHEAVNEVRDGKLYLNPGECCGWVNDVPTCAILDLGAMKADVIEVHE